MRESEEHNQNRRFFRILSLVLAVVTMATGYLYNRNREQRLRRAVERELVSVAELKVDDILKWRAERLGDGAVVSTGVNLVAFTKGFPSAGLDEGSRSMLVSRFRTIRSACGYDRIFLMDAAGEIILSFPEEGPVDSRLAGFAMDALREGRALFHDFYRCPEDGRVYLAVSAPIARIGVIILRMDPADYLYPFVARWPTERRTAETLLVRREGNEVVFLTPLRFNPSPVLSLSFDIDERTDLPAAQAVRGREGVYAGPDYRGVSVLSVLRAVPGTPWFLVARMDLEEVDSMTLEGRFVFSLLILSLITAEMFGILAVMRRHRLMAYRKNERAARALFEAEERLRKALESSNQELEKRVEERSAQLLDANRALAASNSELEAFAYSVAHDLRAPLRAIGGFSRILEEDHAERLEEEGLRLLGVLRGNVEKMDGQIADILELSRLGRMNLVRRKVDMQEMARDVFRKVTPPRILETFDFKVGDLPEAEADPSMMERVWSNLLSNAVKYSMPSPAHVVEVEGREEEGWRIYEVRDRGVGFDPRYAGKLFNLFQRLHGSTEFEGTGLGLAIVKKIITRHGGKVWADGNPGGGARFFFAVPAQGAIGEAVGE